MNCFFLKEMLLNISVDTGLKNGKEDLLKAIHFIEMIIERDYSKTETKNPLDKKNYWGILKR